MKATNLYLQVSVANELAAAIGVFIIVLMATVIKSYYSGFLREVLDEQQRRLGDGHDVDQKLETIQTRIKETHRLTGRNGDKIDDLGEAVLLLHRDDDDVMEQELRRKVGVEKMGDDIFTREDHDDE